MSTIQFDTLGATRRLRDAGFAEPQAEAVIRVVAQAHEALVTTEYLDRKFEALERRFEGIDRKFDSVDRKFDSVDRKFDIVDHKFDSMEKNLTIKLGTMMALAVGVVTALSKLL